MKTDYTPNGQTKLKDMSLQKRQLTGQQFIILRRALRTGKHTTAYGVLQMAVGNPCLGADITRMTDAEAIEYLINNFPVVTNVHESINFYGRHNINGLKALNFKRYVSMK